MRKFIFICLLLGLPHTNAASLNEISSTTDSQSFQLALVNSSINPANNENIDSEKNVILPSSPIPRNVWLITAAILGLFGMRQMRNISDKSETI